MITNNITFNTETRKLKHRDYDFLGVSGENEIEQIVFKLSAFIKGTGIVEIEKSTIEGNKEKNYIELEQKDDSYVLVIKNSLLDVAKPVNMQLHITQENVEVFKSDIFEMQVKKAINATETIPEQYPKWIDVANAKIAKIDRLNSDFEKLKQDVETAEKQRNADVTTAINNIHTSQAEYDENAKKKTEKFNETVDDNLTNLVDTSSKLVKNFNDNYDEKLEHFNENSAEENRKFSENSSKKVQEYNDLSAEKESVLNTIAKGVQDMATAIQFAEFEIDEDMNLIINTSEKLTNTNFTLDKETGELEVEIHG